MVIHCARPLWLLRHTVALIDTIEPWLACPDVNLNVCTQVQRNTNNALSRKRSMSPENYCNTRKGLRLQLVADRRRFENRFRKFERKIKQTWCVYRNCCRWMLLLILEEGWETKKKRLFIISKNRHCIIRTDMFTTPFKFIHLHLSRQYIQQ